MASRFDPEILTVSWPGMFSVYSSDHSMTFCQTEVGALVCGIVAGTLFIVVLLGLALTGGVAALFLYKMMIYGIFGRGGRPVCSCDYCSLQGNLRMPKVREGV